MERANVCPPACPRRLVALFAALWLGVAGLSSPARAEQDETVIVVLGDSLTAGYGLPNDEAFPSQLEAALRKRGHKVRVVNAGVSGDTTAAALRRLDWALTGDADAVIVELGGNDALQGLPPGATKNALSEILEKLEAKGLPVLLAGMEAPRNLGKEYVTAFGAIYPALAARYSVLLYPFFLEGAALNAELMQKDGIHPNGKGVTVIVDNILPKVEALMAASQANEDG
ncbi:arylesterase [Methyloceanibacter methanicus]|uniref:Arylesterase n=2 Tax=Methyloceanibacter methanicus TaxID=1774968 RepID=A0A1E3W4C7_9HYPH|nr:arylesterase [Methyloceanibacter methanicus]